MTAEESDRARFESAMGRFRDMASFAAQDCLLAAVERESSNTDLKAAAFEVLVTHISDLEKALAASDIPPDTELGKDILKLARSAFCTRYYSLLAALGPDGAA